MLRFLLCSFALVLLYPTGIDLYLVGLPQIAQDLQASEPQLHIAFSIYLGGMAATMLATAPSYCERYAQQLNLGLVTRPIPLAKEQQDKLIIPFTMIWHKRNAYSSKLKWLKHTIRSLYDSGEFGSGHLS